MEDLEDHILLPEFGERGRQTVDSRPSPLRFDESQEGWLADTAIATMRTAVERQQPFLLHVSFPRPHQCTTPCQEFWDLYDAQQISLPPNADYDLEAAGKAPHMIASARRWRESDWQLFEPKTFEAGRRRKLHGYLGAVSQVDAAVGKLLDYLRASGLAEDTIVVYTSDHGDYAAEHGIMEKAPGICSDAITRVPLIWWAPGRIEAGACVSDVVELVDISSTLCALAGVEAMETGDGRDLSALAGGRGRRVRAAGRDRVRLEQERPQGAVPAGALPARDVPRRVPRAVSANSTIWRTTPGRCAICTLRRRISQLCAICGTKCWSG